MRRVVFYLFFDPQGRVDDYVTQKLEHLRKHADHIFVVSNSVIEAGGRARLEAVADTVWERENVGFDVWAYKESMERFGDERLAEFDEIILMNYTFFGPVGSFEPLFERMDSDLDLDFWGISEHGAVTPHPISKTGVMHAHLQSHWIAIRRSLAQSEAFKTYWSEMPMITSYDDSVMHHEARFTNYFTERGYKHVAAFPQADYGTVHPIMESIVQMLGDGCPIVKRRTFFHDPLYFDSRGVRVADVFKAVTDRGYDQDLMLQNLARTSGPRELMTNLSLLEVMPDVDLGYVEEEPLRIVAIVHAYYPEMLEELIASLDHLPGAYDLVVTTGADESRTQILDTLDRLGRTADVRVVASNRGRDVAAFFVDCRDVLERADYDLVVKIHSKKSPQDGPNLGEAFKSHLIDNLLPTDGYARNLVHLFQRHKSLGMVMPPVIHFGYQTLGRSWYKNRELAELEAARLGIVVPLDPNTPVAAYGSMFVARPEALRLLVQAGYSHDDFPDESGYADGALSHVVERLVAYATLSEGFHVREVLSLKHAAMDYKLLEYRAQALGAVIPGNARQQVTRARWAMRALRREDRRRAAGSGGSEIATNATGSRLARKKEVARGHQRLAVGLRPIYAALRRAYRGVTGR